MKKFLAIILSAAMLLSACSGGGSSAATPAGNVPAAGTSAPAASTPTMEFKEVYGADIETLNYLEAVSEEQFRIAANIVDTLVEYDKYGVVKPALATEWSVSDDGLTWTFKIREGVKWMTYDGEAYGADLKAQDFVIGMQWILEPVNAASNEWILEGVIKNAAEYFAGEIADFGEVGVKAEDDYTLVYTLEKPTPYFLSMVTYTAFMPVNGDFLMDQGDMFGMDHVSLLYNGAYILQNYSPQAQQILVKNEAYWDRNNVFVTKITRTYNKENLTIGPELFLRGENMEAFITGDILDSWMNDPEKSKYVRPSMNGNYSYFYALNFNPQFDAQYEPENWKIAVNNENFRKAVFHALDRVSAILTDEPYDPQAKLLNTITPPNIVELNGVDYTQLEALADFTATDSFDPQLAVEYKEKAMTELEGKATFPIKVLTSYNPNTRNWDKRCQIVEQQIENLLGSDFIDIVIEPGPATGFLSEVRRSGKFALLECNWGPDYADPETYTDPFSESGSYNKPHMAEGYTDANGEKIYTNLLNEAKNQHIDLAARYEAFSKAEAFLIEHAFIIPYQVSNEGYKASYWNPFESQYSPFGISYMRYKGRKVLDEPMDTEAYNAAYAAWLSERAEALK